MPLLRRGSLGVFELVLCLCPPHGLCPPGLPDSEATESPHANPKPGSRLVKPRGSQPARPGVPLGTPHLWVLRCGWESGRGPGTGEATPRLHSASRWASGAEVSSSPSPVIRPRLYIIKNDAFPADFTSSPVPSPSCRVRPALGGSMQGRRRCRALSSHCGQSGCPVSALPRVSGQGGRSPAEGAAGQSRRHGHGGSRCHRRATMWSRSCAASPPSDVDSRRGWGGGEARKHADGGTGLSPHVNEVTVPAHSHGHHSDV